MSNTSKANRAADEVAAWIGLDWADKEHHVALFDVASSKVEVYTLEQSPEALQEWLATLRERYGGSKVAVVLEQSKGSVLYALMECDLIVLYPVNPQSLANYRKAFYTSGAKDDPEDAVLLQEMVRKHPERFRPWVPDDPDTRSLQLLVRGRRKLVDDLKQLTNQVRSQLKSYYPQALKWAGNLETPQACEFLQQWPTLEALQGARVSRLRKFYSKYGKPAPETIDRRIEKIKAAVPLTRDRAAVLGGSMMVRALAAQIRPLIAAIDQFDDEIERLFRKHPDRPVFESFPGAGAVYAPRLLAVFGADRERWESSAEVQMASGIAPVTEQSGNSKWVHWRIGCPKFTRQSLHEFAGSSIVWCDWARAYYWSQRNLGKKHHVALRALAYKWTRILFVCWKKRIPYKEEVFLQSLAQRGSPLSELAKAAPRRKARKKAA